MRSSHVKSLHVDISKEILFGLPVRSVIDYCNTNHQLNKFCKSNKFWKEYILHNHDLNQLFKADESFIIGELGKITQRDIINSKLDHILEIAEETESLENITPTFLAGALYLENSKYIKRLQISEQSLIPGYISELLISPYDSIRYFIGGRGFLYGDQIAVIKDEDGRIKVKVLAFNEFIITNFEDLEDINPETMLKDIFINDKPLLSYIESNISFT
jgi:hypothetical protein